MSENDMEEKMLKYFDKKETEKMQQLAQANLSLVVPCVTRSKQVNKLVRAFFAGM